MDPYYWSYFPVYVTWSAKNGLIDYFEMLRNAVEVLELEVKFSHILQAIKFSAI